MPGGAARHKSDIGCPNIASSASTATSRNFLANASTASPIVQNKITSHQVENRIIKATALSRADVRSAIAALAEIVREEILAGRSVALADLGSFRVVSTGKRMATEEEVTADTLKAPRIQFLPKMEMRNLTKSIQRVVLRPGEAEPTPENPLG